MIIFDFSRWLCNPQIDTKTRKWAIEGLAYLTNDADVKDDFVDDEPAMQAMFELAKVRKQQPEKNSEKTKRRPLRITTSFSLCF